MLTFTSSQGFSKEAKYVAKTNRENHRQLQRSNVLGIEAVRNELGTVYEDCRVPNWDGYGAVPVTQDTLRNAYIFLEALPLGFPAPSIGAEPDGALTLEWHRTRRQTISVSVTDNGDLHYAALLGPNRRYGTEIFSGAIPEPILRFINEVYAI